MNFEEKLAQAKEQLESWQKRLMEAQEQLIRWDTAFKLYSEIIAVNTSEADVETDIPT